jgi:hypothetical protein
MSLFKVALPELDQFPLERRKAIVEGFNTSADTAALRERLGKLPFRLGAVLMIPVMGVMVWGYDKGTWPCMLAGSLCFAIGVPVGILFQFVLMRRAFRRYVQKSSIDGG